MRVCEEDGVAAGGNVRVGCKPTAAWDQPTADGAAKTTTQGLRLQRGALSQMDSRQAAARAEKKPANFDDYERAKSGPVNLPNRRLTVQVCRM